MKSKKQFPSPRWTIGALAVGLTLSTLACGGTTIDSGTSGASGGNAPVASAGTSGDSSPPIGASAGAAGLDASANGGAAGAPLDYSLSPCGQQVDDLDTWCAQSGGQCTLPAGPACAAETYDVFNGGFAYQPPSVRSGCGYLFVAQAVIEGDNRTIAYDLKTNQLVYYSDLGWLGKACEVTGERAGQLPSCAQTQDLCADADAGAEGGAPTN